MTSPELREHTNGVAWLGTEGLPRSLSGALTEVPDTSHVWEQGQGPDVQAVRAAVAQACQARDLQDEYADDLAEALSPADLAADNAAARKVRDARRRRATDRELERVEAEAEAARHEQRLDEARRRQVERTAQLRQRVAAETDPGQGLARLNLARWLAPAVALVPAAFAAVAEAVNVGDSMSEISPDTEVINWSLGPLFTLPLVAIMIAQLLGAVPLPGQPASTGGRMVGVQVALLVAAVVMNTGPHLLQETSWRETLPWLSVPAGFGLSMYLVPSLRAQLNRRFVEAAEAAGDWLETSASPGDGQASDLHRTKSGLSPDQPLGEASGEGVPAPARRRIADHRQRLVELVQAGEIDPHTVSVNAARLALRCRREVARDLLVEYGRTDLEVTS